MAMGKVKWFNNAKGYGFILPDEGGEDLFAHYSSIEMDGYKTLKAGQEVGFDIVEGPKGLHAVNIRYAASEATASEATAAQDTAVALGVNFIKMWVNAVPEPGLKITPEIRTAIIDEAIANGAIPVAHIDDEADGRQLVEAGLRDFLHSTVLTFGPGAGVPVDKPTPRKSSETGSEADKWCVWNKMTRFGECDPAIIGLEGR